MSQYKNRGYSSALKLYPMRSGVNLNLPNRMIEFCDDYIDQTNCSDPSRVGIDCQVGGYNTTVARQILCLERQTQDEDKFRFDTIAADIDIPIICDDGIDKACVHSSGSCFIHKHLLCDGHSDCGVLQLGPNCC